MFKFVLNLSIFFYLCTLYSINCQNPNNLLNENACCTALANRQHLKVFTPDPGPNFVRHYQYHATSGKKCLSFKIRTDKDAHIALANKPKLEEPFIEIVIAGWGGTKSVIRRKGSDHAEEYNNVKLNINEDLGFWITWKGGKILVGKEGDSNAFMTWHDPEPFDVNYFGFSTCGGSTGTWTIEDLKCPN